MQFAVLFLFLLSIAWLGLVIVLHRTSRAILISGLLLIAVVAVACIAHGDIAAQNIGLRAPQSWLATLGLAIGWVAIMFLYTPVADRIATRFFRAPPTLGAFRALQESRAKLVAGILIAWVLGGFLEELVLRGIVLRGSAAFLAGHTGDFAAIAIAAAGALIIHLYQGLRAASS